MAAIVECARQWASSSIAVEAGPSRALSSSRASTACSVCCGPIGRASSLRTTTSLRSASEVRTSLFRGAQRTRRSASPVVRAGASEHGKDPEFSDEDYIVVGVAHCFVKKTDGKLTDKFIIEPIPAGALECMENGGATCYKHAHATTLGVALKQDVSLLPSEFQGVVFSEDFDFRTKCASRTWKRDHAREFLLGLVPKDGVRSDWNFKLEDKRVLNMENIVKDEDNIKQDISIDVYGRTPKEETTMSEEIAKMYNT